MPLNVLILDTNIVLDCWVYSDPQTQALRTALQTQTVYWLSTAAMREECWRVLAYPHIARRMEQGGQTAALVMQHFDTHAALRDTAPQAPVRCKDPDDQKFIDLAVTHRAGLISKDKAVLCMRCRLEKLHVPFVESTWSP